MFLPRLEDVEHRRCCVMAHVCYELSGTGLWFQGYATVMTVCADICNINLSANSTWKTSVLWQFLAARLCQLHCYGEHK